MKIKLYITQLAIVICFLVFATILVQANNSMLDCDPPTLTGQSGDTTICAGLNATFSVTIVGDSLSYQWQVSTGGKHSSFTNISNGGVYSGATSDSLVITDATTSMSGYEYQCIITGCSSYITSNVVILTVASGTPTITSQPVNDTTCTGTNALFYIYSSGAGIMYQWQENSGGGFTNITASGGDAGYSFVYTNPVADSMNGYQYRCILSNVCSLSDTSTTAMLISNLPSIISQPVDALICASSDTSFSLQLSDTSGVIFQWQVSTGGKHSSFTNISNGGIYSGATSDSLILTVVPDSMNGYEYQCVLTGACIDYSSVATLSVASGTPTITSQPVNDTTCTGTNALFYIYSSGAGITYQWQENSGSGFTNITASGGDAGYSFVYTNPVADSMNGYQYRCILSNVCSLSDTSTTAMLISNLPSPITQPTDAEVCASSNTSFSIQLSDTSGVIFQWQVNTGGRHSSFTNISNGGIYSGATTDSLILTDVSSDMNGYEYQCVLTGASTSPSDVATLTVNTTVPTVTTSAIPTSICYGSSSILAASGASSYTWSPITGLSPDTGSSVTATLTTTTTYTVTGNSGGCTNTANVIITVDPQLYADAGTSETFCPYTNITLGGSPSASGGISPYSYSWTSSPSGFTSSSPNPIVTPKRTTTYTLTVTDSNGCAVNSSVGVDTITNSFTYTTPACVGQPVILTAAVSGASYSWMVPCSFSSSLSSDGQNDTITSDSSGYFITSLQVSDGSCLTLPYYQLIYIDSSCEDLEMAKMKAKSNTIYESISVYPTLLNSNTHLNVTIPTNKTAIVDIYNIMGEKSLEFPLISGNNRLSLSSDNLSAGTYIYCVILNDGAVKVGELIWTQ